MYYNKATIIGNVTRDPELRTLPSGVPVATFGVATNRVWKDQAGMKKEDTQFHNVVVFAKQADIMARYAKKGTLVLVEGRMQTRSWDDKQSGEKKYRTEIVADRVQFGPRREGGGAPGGGYGGGAPGAPAEAPQDMGAGKDSGGDVIDYPDEVINPDDIPF